VADRSTWRVGLKSPVTFGWPWVCCRPSPISSPLSLPTLWVSLRLMASVSNFMDETIAAYLSSHTTQPDEIEQRLIRETQTMADGIMQIGHAQAQFMTMLTALLKPKLIVEIGTFTGYSTLVMAKALAEDAKLITCDVSTEWTSVGRPYWEEAGVADRIDLRIGPASETLAAFNSDTVVDLAFVDADKTGYVDYFEQLVPMLNQRGVILVDNVLWSGRVADNENQQEDTVALRKFNSHVVADHRVQVAILPIGDGLSMISLRSGS